MAQKLAENLTHTSDSLQLRMIMLTMADKLRNRLTHTPTTTTTTTTRLKAFTFDQQ